MLFGVYDGFVVTFESLTAVVVEVVVVVVVVGFGVVVLIVVVDLESVVVVVVVVLLLLLLSDSVLSGFLVYTFSQPVSKSIAAVKITISFFNILSPKIILSLIFR